MPIYENTKSLLEDNEYHSLARRFPGSTFDANQKSWMVQKFFGQQYTNPHLELSLSRIISQIEGRSLGKRLPSSSTPSGIGQNSQNLNVLEDLAKELGVKTVRRESRIDDGRLSFVLPEQIKLVFPSEAQVMLFPRGLRCSECDYYILYKELDKLRTLICPSCSKGKLEQPSWLFYCNKCCLQQEIAPPFKRIEDGPRFKCTDSNCNGYLKLRLESSLSSSKWVCSETGEKKWGLIYYCPKCSRWNEPKNPVLMQLVRTTASYLRQLTLSAVYIDNNTQFSVDAVKPSWSLKNSDLLRTIRSFGIEDIQIIDDVESFEVVYGYSSYDPESSPVPFKVMSDSRRFDYSGFTMRNIGNGLLILLDKNRVMEFSIKGMIRDCQNDPKGLEQAKEFESKLINGKLQYEDVVSYTISVLNDRNRRYQKTRSSLFKLIHSMEHAMTYHASIVTGLEESSFIGKVLLRDCGILIYERDQVEAGGVKYIAQNLLLRWLNFSIRQVRDCRYECTDGCVKCLYMQDPLCHPLLPWEVESYTLPNSLLDRKILYEFWDLEKAISRESIER
jgi:hypothetical protein